VRGGTHYYCPVCRGRTTTTGKRRDRINDADAIARSRRCTRCGKEFETIEVANLGEPARESPAAPPARQAPRLRLREGRRKPPDAPMDNVRPYKPG